MGRVILTDNAIPVGIFTERHVLKRVANNNLAPKTSSVKDAMTSPLRAVGDKTHIVEALGEMIRRNPSPSSSRRKWKHRSE